MKEQKWYGVKFLLPYLKNYKIRVFFTLIAMVGVALTSAGTAYMMKPILNNIFVEKDNTMLTIMPLVIIAIFTTRGVARFFSSYLANSIGIEIMRDIREKMYAKAINASYYKIQSKTVGDINAHIIQTVLNMRTIIAKTIPNFIISAFTIVALVGMLLYLNFKLSIFAIVFASIVIFPVKFLGKKVKSHVLNAEKMVSGLTDNINESFKNLDLVRVYNNTEYEKKRFNKVLDGYKRFQLKLSKYQELTSPLMEFFVSLAVASVVYFGGKVVIEEQMSAGDFFAFLTALMMLYAPIKIITKNSLVLNILDTYVKRINNILSLPQEESNLPSFDEEFNGVEFKNVYLKIAKKEILKDINLNIKRGDSVAIVGKTGAGKSTILSLLFAFRKATKGSVLINGKDITNFNPNSIREQISYVNQAAGIFNGTIKDNIIYGLEYDEERYKKAKELAQCDFIEELDKKDNYQVGENGKKLSGGQRQRVALARAIYKDAPIFVLDEATSALDAKTENMIQSSLKKIMQEKTTIVIAHRLNTIKNADIVIVISDGKVVEQGSYEEVSKTKAFIDNFALKEEKNER